MILNNPLPLTIAIAKPLILRYFPIFVTDLPISTRDSAHERFDRELRHELVVLFFSAVAADCYWADGTLLIPNPTLSSIRVVTADCLHDVAWCDGPDHGVFKLSTAFERADEIRQTSVRNGYARVDWAVRETTTFGYNHEHGGFHFACLGDGGQGGQPVLSE